MLAADSQSLALADGTLDLTLGVVRRGTKATPLTSREVELLVYLAEHTDRLVPEEELLTKVWNYRANYRTRAVAQTITRLRKKLEADPAHPKSLITVHGRGYRLIVVAAPTRPRVELTTAPLGRDSLVPVVLDALSPQRFITLHGPGGVGKTKLAAAVGALWQELGKPMVRVCLTAHTDPTDAVAQALGVGPESIAETLSDREALLILDDAESQRHGVQDLASSLLGGDARLLVTSRALIGSRAERRIVVPPLSPEDGRELFLERARRVAGAERVSEFSLHAIDRLCEALDGLPLAIELAASRASVLSPEMLLELQDQHQTLLSDPGRGARHATLDACMAASWADLAPQPQQLLRRLAIFEGPFSTHDVLSVGPAIGLGERVDALQAITAGSWLDPAPGHRFRLLTSIRSFLRNTPGWRAEAEEAEAELSKAWCERLRTLERGSAARRDWIGARPEDLLARHRDMRWGQAATALLGRRLALWVAERSAPKLRDEVISRQLQLARSSQDPGVVIDGLMAASAAAAYANDQELAARGLDEAENLLPRLTGIDRAWAEIEVRTERSRWHRGAGSYQAALDVLAPCDQIARPLPDGARAMLHSQRARALAPLGRNASALEQLRMAQELSPSDANLDYQGHVLHMMGRYDEALAKFEELGEPYGIGMILIDQGRYEEAAAALSDVPDRMRRESGRLNELTAVIGLVRATHLAGNHERALEISHRGMRLTQPGESPRRLAMLWAHSRCLISLKRHQEAAEHLKQIGEGHGITSWAASVGSAVVAHRTQKPFALLPQDFDLRAVSAMVFAELGPLLDELLAAHPTRTDVVSAHAFVAARR